MSEDGLGENLNNWRKLFVVKAPTVEGVVDLLLEFKHPYRVHSPLYFDGKNHITVIDLPKRIRIQKIQLVKTGE